jgi:cholesterol transport system auxiliary component
MVVLVAAAGCVDLKSSYPERKFYTLSAERAGTAGATAREGVLRVRRFTASKLSEGSELVTRTAEAVYESDFYNVFFVPPATQLTEQAHRWLGGSGLFGTVVGTGSSVPETHVLEGNLVALYADRRQSTSAVIEVQFMLVRVTSDPSAVIFQKNYRESVAVPDEGAEALVRHWNSGLGRILAALEADLAKVDRSAKK